MIWHVCGVVFVVLSGEKKKIGRALLKVDIHRRPARAPTVTGDRDRIARRSLIDRIEFNGDRGSAGDRLIDFCNFSRAHNIRGCDLFFQ